MCVALLSCTEASVDDLSVVVLRQKPTHFRIRFPHSLESAG